MVAVAGALVVALIAQAPAGAVEPVEPIAPVEPVDCGAPERPPDPRCDDSLDGRDPPPTSPARRAAQTALAPPRVAARLVFLPVVQGVAEIERHSLIQWLTAITTSDDGKVGVRPEVQYATGFVPSIGLGLFYRRLRDPGSEVTARLKAGSTEVWRAEVGLSGPDWLGLSIAALWDRRDDRVFAGIGPQPEDSPNVRSRYRGDIVGVEARWLAPRAGPVAFTLRAGADGRNYHADEVRGGPSIAVAYGAPPETCAALGVPSPCTDPALVPGFYGGRKLLHQRARVALDLLRGGRDSSGIELGLDGTFVEGIINDPSRHVRMGFDVLGSIGGIDRVLLLRFVAAAVEPIGTAPVPFDELISPTGAEGIRGLYYGLLRDRSGLVGSAEYRWLISSTLDASLFVDEGAVAGAWFSGLAPDSFRTSVGIGLRFYRRGLARYWEDSLQRGVQLAYAPGGGGVRLLLSAAAF